MPTQNSDLKPESKIYLAGHTGLVGSAILKELKEQGFTNILVNPHSKLDLLHSEDVANFFKREKPEYVILAAAKVGGIIANNTFPAEFIYENLQIQNNVIHNSYLNGVKKLLFLGSSCIYPRNCPQPIKEEYLLTGELEPTNEPYAIAKIAGIKMCQSYNRQYKTNYICVMPTNLYGTNDDFHSENSHVIPGLINRVHNAKINNTPSVTIWGTGKPKREFLYSKDLASACIFLLKTYSENQIINIGAGEELSIKELAEAICSVIGYKGSLLFDTTKPDGTPRKLLDLSKITKSGWSSKTNLKDGLKETYQWFLENTAKTPIHK